MPYKDDVKFLLDKFDADKDGKIGVADFQQIFQQRQALRGATMSRRALNTVEGSQPKDSLGSNKLLGSQAILASRSTNKLT